MGIIQAQQEGQRLTTLTGLITSVKEDVWWRVLGVNEGEYITPDIVNILTISYMYWQLAGPSKFFLGFTFFILHFAFCKSAWKVSNLQHPLQDPESDFCHQTTPREAAWSSLLMS